jgi:D-aminopeptidase
VNQLAFVLSAAFALMLCTSALADKPRARDLGIPFDGAPGKFNAITDVPGVAVGYATLNRDQGAHAIRTGVTAIVPRGRASLLKPVFAGIFSLNGNGEMTGTHWIEEAGTLEGPLMLTNTHSVGAVRDAVIQWRIKQGSADASGYWWSLPVVAETWDGDLNDVNGFHVKAEHAFAAIDSAQGGAVVEGNVGGGTGMTCHDFKCGSGTSSRVVKVDAASYVVGTFVQANYGVREELRIAGVPVGKFMQANPSQTEPRDNGSIIIAIATDAPLLPHQLKRMARRAALGLARNGSYAGHGSGDIFIAFSTANEAGVLPGAVTLRALGNEQMDPLFLATVQAVEESIVNAMIAAETMVGVDGHKAVAIDHKQLQEVLRRHGRLNTN